MKMLAFSRIFRLVRSMGVVAGVLGCLLAGSAWAAKVQVNTTLNASANTVGAGVPVTLTVSNGPIYQNFPINNAMAFGAGSGLAAYFTYTLTGAVFNTPVSIGDITDSTNPGAIGAVTISAGGQGGDSTVTFSVLSAGTGIQQGDIIVFNIVALGGTGVGAAAPTVTYSLGFAPGVVFNSIGPTSLNAIAPNGVATGTAIFYDGGTPITGCSNVPLDALADAQCTTTFSTLGSHSITVDYSGDTGHFGTAGVALNGGLIVTVGLSAANPPNAQFGVPYSYTFSASGGTAPYAYAALGGGLPPGLTMTAATGVLSGTPTATGVYNFTLTAVDSVNNFGTQTYSLVVTNATQTITFTLPTSGTKGSIYTLNGTASSGLAVTYSVTTPTVCSVSNGVLTLNAGGTCSVTASQAGNATISAAVPVTRTIQTAVGGTIVLRSTDPQSPQMMLGRYGSGQMVFSPLPDPGAKYRLLAVTDLDGNGVADLVYQDTTQGDFGDVHVWADFLPANDHLLRSVKLAWLVEAVGDMDGDGKGDLVFRFTGNDGVPADTGVSYIWFTNGTAVTQVRKRGGAPLSWTLLGAADLNGDRAAEMVYIDPNNQIRILMATAARTCANFTAGSILTGYTALKLADFSGAKRGDILIRNPTTGDVRLISLDARGSGIPTFVGNPDDANAACTATNTSITALTYPGVASDPTWQFYASADLNGDGVTDIIWLRPDGTFVVWLMAANHGAPTVVFDAGTAPVGFNVFQP